MNVLFCSGSGTSSAEPGSPWMRPSLSIVEHRDAVTRRPCGWLDDVARQRDIGLAADLGLVVHAAELAHELAVHGARDRLSSGFRRRGRRNTGSAPCRKGAACARQNIMPCLFSRPWWSSSRMRRSLISISDTSGSAHGSRPAGRDRCAPCRIRPPLPACATGAFRAWSSTSPACRPRRWPARAGDLGRLALLPRRRAGSPPSTRASRWRSSNGPWCLPSRR